MLDKTYLSQLVEKTAEHLLLTGVSTSIAVLTGIPLAILIRERQKLRHATLTLVGIFQTIPSLALLVFFIPILGIGTPPAILALTLYAFLPVIRNTITGLEGVEEDLVDAANGLGFSQSERLLRVEIPLAMPVIVAGIRTAIVIGVGIATLAAFIGAGGLGDFITRGLAVNSNTLILQGAVPAALLAILLDFLVSRIELLCTPDIRRERKSWRKQLFLFCSALFILAIPVTLHLLTTLTGSTRPVIRIGSKNFTEQFILAELMAQSIEHHTDLRVDRRFNLGSVIVCHRALLHKEIDLYPEYTGTGYQVILKQKIARSPKEVYNFVTEAYAEQFQLSWLNPFGFNNTYALIVSAAFADEKNLSTISDIQPWASSLSLAINSEFHERPDGYMNFSKSYQIEFQELREMDTSLMYSALQQGTVDAIIGTSTDGRVQAFRLRALQDDKGFFPPYFAAPVVRSTVLKKHPEIRKALAPLDGVLDEPTMRRLNFEIDGKGRSAAEVARDFLEQVVWK